MNMAAPFYALSNPKAASGCASIPGPLLANSTKVVATQSPTCLLKLNLLRKLNPPDLLDGYKQQNQNYKSHNPAADSFGKKDGQISS